MERTKIKHPELREGEIFLTNAEEERWLRISWQTKRKGRIAYDTQGRYICGYFPVFVQKGEYDAGMKKYRGEEAEK